MNLITRVNPNKTRNSEFQTLYHSIIRITDTFDVTALHISETLKKMKEAAPQVEELNEKERKKPLTETMEQIRRKRNEYVSFLSMQINAQLKSDDSVRMEAAKTLLSIFKQDLSNFSHKSFNAQHALANQFIDRIESDPSLNQWLSLLGIDTVFAKLKAIQGTVTSTHDNRITLLSKRKKFDTAQTKHNLYNLMNDLFKSIEGAALAFPELDYEPLISKLNNEIELQRTTYQQRQTRSAKLNKPASLKIASEANAS
jgi:hypothetical protein